ncbi:Ig-like domain-containing protein [Sanguibacter sp. 25GB23B1]|uniref:Ig-like domain-containing protein n=1 Tax=unclassified Sanguibacter TaxID=2645534 RepID=UPI0032AF515C
MSPASRGVDVTPGGASARAHDDGFSLIEVVVALFLIGIVAAGALLFFVRGAQNTSHLQRTQAASTVATQGMELARSIDPRPASAAATSGLLIGRSKADVDAIWAAADPQDTAQTNAAWDLVTPQAGHTNDALKQVRQTTVSGMDFDVVTLVGTCYRPAAASAGNQSCTATNLGGGVLMYRTTVVVTWDAGTSDQCDSGTCTYRLSALIDPTADASWNLSTKPVAYDDAATYTAGGAISMIEVLANDVITTVTSNPTTILTAPPYGAAAVITSGTKMGAINYTPPTNYSGPVEFTYKLRDAQGRNSNEAIVSLMILPRATNDTATVAKGAAVTIPVAANDIGTGIVPKITAPPNGSYGTATVIGSDIRFVASASAPTGTATFTYIVTDAVAQESTEATVSVSVTAPVLPAADVVVDVPATLSPGATRLKIQEAAGVPTTYKVHVMSGANVSQAPGTTAGIGQLAGSGTTSVTYRPVANTVGFYTLTFQIEDAAGGRSATKTATIRVTPVANPYELSSQISSNSAQTINVVSGNVPSASASGVTYAVTGVPVCSLGWGASVSQNAAVAVGSDTTAGAFQFTKPRWSGGDRNAECTFSYTVTMTFGAQTFATPAATVTVPVRR